MRAETGISMLPEQYNGILIAKLLIILQFYIIDQYYQKPISLMALMGSWYYKLMNVKFISDINCE